jgi:hypothetical protein
LEARNSQSSQEKNHTKDNTSEGKKGRNSKTSRGSKGSKQSRGKGQGFNSSDDFGSDNCGPKNASADSERIKASNSMDNQVAYTKSSSVPDLLIEQKIQPVEEAKESPGLTEAEILEQILGTPR